MGILDLFTARRASSLLDGVQVNAPWASTDSLAPMVISDLLGHDIRLPITRALAITVPAVSKARNLLVSTIAKFALVNKRGDEVLTSPGFFYRTSSNVTPYERMAWTVDDAIFEGDCLWRVYRGVKPEGQKFGPILVADYVPRSLWGVRDGVIWIKDFIDGPERIAQDDEVLYFSFPFEGLLNIAGRTLRGALDQEAAWVGRSRNPIPLIELHQTDDTMTEEEVEAFVQAWATARSSENGAIGYTPPSLTIETHGEVKADLMIEGRNAIRTDVGSFLNVRASMLDGTMGIDSLTYTTTEGERNSFYEFDLPFWTDPIAARLSMDDVVPRGQYVEFNMYTNPNTPAAPAKED